MAKIPLSESLSLTRSHRVLSGKKLSLTENMFKLHTPNFLRFSEKVSLKYCILCLKWMPNTVKMVS